jgi:Rieske Fe-S protein
VNRKEFIRVGCISCIGLLAGLPLLQGCSTQKNISGNIEGDQLQVRTDDFGTADYLVVRHPSLRYPICVLREPGGYTALLMRCTHQGGTLQAAGSRLVCPAHGSEFDRAGQVQQGPASDPLRRFPVTEASGIISINLKKA